MFVLYPNGKEGASGGSGNQKISFLKLGLYFGGIRLAYMFFAAREEKVAIQN